LDDFMTVAIVVNHLLNTADLALDASKPSL
jgi:hypothetical protein